MEINKPEKWSINAVLIYLIFVSQLFNEHWGSKVLIVAAILAIVTSVKSKKVFKNIFWGYSLYFAFCLLSLVWTIDVSKSVVLIGGMLPFLVIPFWINSIDEPLNFSKIFKWITISYLLVGIYTLVMSWWRYLSSGESAEFFYHTLVLPLEANAIYISLWYLMVVLFNIHLQIKKRVDSFFVICNVLLAIYILLLSSKMIFTLMIVSVSILVFPTLKNRVRNLKVFRIGLLTAIVIVISGVILSGSLYSRFKKVSNIGEVNEVLTKKEFGQVYPWNGLTLRVLQLRSFWDIENSESFNPILGVGINNGQLPLNERYKEYNLYAGKKGEANGGFFHYNFHNQYAQTLIETGIIGLVILLFIIFQWFVWAKNEKSNLILTVSLVFVFLMITESLLLRQKGIVAFVFIPFLIMKVSKNNLKLG
jgi:O-antigen ligase